MNNTKYLTMMLDVIAPHITGYFKHAEQRELMFKILSSIKKWDKNALQYKHEFESILPIGEEDSSYSGTQAVNAGCCILCILQYMETGDDRNIEEFDQHWVEIIDYHVGMRLISEGVVDITSDIINQDQEFIAGLKQMDLIKTQCV